MKKWTVEISVSDNWIEDGFILKEDLLKEKIWELLPYAFEREIIVKIID